MDLTDIYRCEHQLYFLFITEQSFSLFCSAFPFFPRLEANSTSDSRIPWCMAVEGHKIHPLPPPPPPPHPILLCRPIIFSLVKAILMRLYSPQKDQNLTIVVFGHVHQNLHQELARLRQVYSCSC